MQSSNTRWLLTGIVQILQPIYNLFVKQYLQPYITTHIFHKGMSLLVLSDPILFYFLGSYSDFTSVFKTYSLLEGICHCRHH